MTPDQVLARFDEQVRRGVVAEPGFRVERAGPIVRILGHWNCVVHSPTLLRMGFAPLSSVRDWVWAPEGDGNR